MCGVLVGEQEKLAPQDPEEPRVLKVTRVPKENKVFQENKVSRVKEVPKVSKGHKETKVKLVLQDLKEHGVFKGRSGSRR